MSEHAQNSEAVEVVAISFESSVERTRVDATTPEALIDLVRDSVDASELNVDIDSAFSSSGFDDDQFIALASVLVHHGVRVFTTCRPTVVSRILAMNSAIEAGSVEVLGT